MARIRTIKPEFWTDERIVDLSAFARLLFVGIWNFADDHGFIADKPRQIKMQVLPGDDVDATRLVDELVDAGLLERWHDGDTPLLRVRGFARHQTIKNPGLPRYPNAAAAAAATSPDTPPPSLPPSSLSPGVDEGEDAPTPTPALTNPGARKGKGREEASPPRASARETPRRSPDPPRRPDETRPGVVDVHEIDALFEPLGRAPNVAVRQRCISVARQHGTDTVRRLVRRVADAKPDNPTAYLRAVINDPDAIADCAEQAAAARAATADLEQLRRRGAAMAR